jgi:hypothetical protein
MDKLKPNKYIGFKNTNFKLLHIGVVKLKHYLLYI